MKWRLKHHLAVVALIALALGIWTNLPVLREDGVYRAMQGRNGYYHCLDFHPNNRFYYSDDVIDSAKVQYQRMLHFPPLVDRSTYTRNLFWIEFETGHGRSKWNGYIWGNSLYLTELNTITEKSQKLTFTFSTYDGYLKHKYELNSIIE